MENIIIFVSPHCVSSLHLFKNLMLVSWPALERHVLMELEKVFFQRRFGIDAVLPEFGPSHGTDLTHHIPDIRKQLSGKV